MIDFPAPIALFVYARPQHTRATLMALAKNELAPTTDLIVYADGPRNTRDLEAVTSVRDLVRSFTGFRNVELVERDENYGLARNISTGVSEVCARYGRVIVVEDDIVTSPHFLWFMNAALQRYAEEKRVWHVSGWNYPIATDGLGDAFFIRVMNCWGWATWADRWQYYEKDTERLIAEFDRNTIRAFDLNNSGVFWSQILGNKRGLIDTWAIYWYAAIFRNGGLCLNPAISYVENIGLDGSGMHHCGDRSQYLGPISDLRHLSFPAHIAEHAVGIQRIIEFYSHIKPTLQRRLLAKASAMLRMARLQ